MGDIKETIEKIEKMVCNGVEEISRRGNLDTNSLDHLGKMADIIKDLAEAKGKSDGGSFSRSYMDDGYGRRMRDSRGRYMNDGYEAYNREYSRDGYNAEYGANYGADYGHSRDEEKEFLRYKMQNAKNDQEREMIRRKLESM